MNEALGALALGLWYGLTGPLAVHIGIVLVHRNPGTNVSRVVRFLAAPAGMVGIVGIAATSGKYLSGAHWLAAGFVVGAGIYGLSAWLHHKHTKARGT
jgi:hypothetical protein